VGGGGTTSPPKQHYGLQKNWFNILNLWIVTSPAVCGISTKDQSKRIYWFQLIFYWGIHTSAHKFTLHQFLYNIKVSEVKNALIKLWNKENSVVRSMKVLSFPLFYIIYLSLNLRLTSIHLNFRGHILFM
jgi:hypothetical protein